MNNETVAVDVRLDKATIDSLNKLTKAQLVERICVVVLERHVAENKAATLQTKLDKAEAYVEQGRAMIEAVMERWHEYDC